MAQTKKWLIGAVEVFQYPNLADFKISWLTSRFDEPVSCPLRLGAVPPNVAIDKRARRSRHAARRYSEELAERI